MQDTNNIINRLFDEALPSLESWFREVIRDEVKKAMNEERQKAKPERNLTRDEVCELLHITKPTLWKKTKQGEIKAINIGRRVLYPMSEVKRYFEEG